MLFNASVIAVSELHRYIKGYVSKRGLTEKEYHIVKMC